MKLPLRRSIERPAPHCRPHEVAFEAEYQLENLCVEVVAAVIGSESVFHPCGKARCLVVKEDAAVAHGRLPVGVHTFINIYARVAFYGRVGPVVPRRHADLARQLVYSVDCSAPVASGDNHLVARGSDDVFLEFAFKFGLVDYFLLHQLVYLGRMSDSAYDYLGVRLVGSRNFRSAHFVNVSGEVSRRNRHSLAVVGVYVDGDFALVVEQHVP